MASSNERPPSPLDRAFLTNQPGAGTLHLVRHGQQEWPDPATSVAGDWVDPPLSALGRRQAEAVGEHLADEPISAVYSSHLSRANDTGKAIANHHGHEVHVIEALEEIRLFVDLPQDQRPSELLGEMTLDGVRERFTQTKRWDVYPESERSHDFRRRISTAIESVIVRHPGETVVIACHAGVINAYLAELLSLSEDIFFRPYHASTHRLRFGNDRRVIDTLNGHAHLPGELLTN